MTTHQRALGDLGEEKASQYLIKKGYAIIGRNWATKFGEIDIIAKKRDGTYVFIEVKTARAGSFFRPEENITPAKLQRLLRTVELYCRSKHISPHVLWQIDAITVTYHGDTASDISHWENINIR